MASFNLDGVSLCSNFDVEDEDEMNRFISAVINLDTPSSIKNRIVEHDEDEPFETEIGFGVIGGGNPIESNSESLLFNSFGGTQTGHIHIYSSEEYISDFMELYQNIINIVGGAEVDPLIYNMTIDEGFDDLNLKVDVELPSGVPGEIYKNRGVRFDYNDDNSDFLFQHNPSGNQTSLRYGTGQIQAEPKSTKNLIERELELPRNLIEEL
jgi:hypothetical protein